MGARGCMWGSCRMNALWTLVAELSGVAWRGVVGGWRGGVSAGWRGGVLWQDVIGGCGLAGSPPRDLLAGSPRFGPVRARVCASYSLLTTYLEGGASRARVQRRSIAGKK